MKIYLLFIDIGTHSDGWEPTDETDIRFAGSFTSLEKAKKRAAELGYTDVNVDNNDEPDDSPAKIIVTTPDAKPKSDDERDLLQVAYAYDDNYVEYDDDFDI